MEHENTFFIYKGERWIVIRKKAEDVTSDPLQYRETLGVKIQRPDGFYGNWMELPVGATQVYITGMIPVLIQSAVKLSNDGTAIPPMKVTNPEQPIPTEGKQSVTDELITFLRERQTKGIQTYGRSLETFNGRDAHRDALEESLDLNQYIFQMYLEEKAQREQYAIELNSLRAFHSKVKNLVLGQTFYERIGELVTGWILDE